MRGLLIAIYPRIVMRKLKFKLTDNINISNGISTFLNPFSYYILRKDINILEKFDKIYCDGFLFVLMVKVFRVKLKRVSFDMTSLAPHVFSYADKNEKSIAVIGGTDGVSEKFIKKYSESYKNVKFVYAHNGFFCSADSRKNIIKKLKDISPNIVIVGMGAKLQETFLLDLVDQGWSGIGYTCGGFLHQSIAKKDDYYPKFFDKTNLRWLYRIYKEPHLWKRYFLIYPFAVVLFFKDFLVKKKFSN